MNKGQKALDEIHETIKVFNEHCDNGFIDLEKLEDSAFSTIEEELKAYYELQDEYEEEHARNEYLEGRHRIDENRIKQAEKKLKALEVIKRFSYYDFCFLKYLLDEGKITKEEYDLLKEVLL